MKKKMRVPNMDPAVRKAANLAGQMAGRSVVLAEQAAKQGFTSAKRTSGIAAREFMKGFKRTRGKKALA